MQTVRLDARWGERETLYNGMRLKSMCCLGVVEADTGADIESLEHEPWPNWCSTETETVPKRDMIHDVNSHAANAWNTAIISYNDAIDSPDNCVRALNDELRKVYAHVEPLIHDLRDAYGQEPVEIEFVPVTVDQFIEVSKEWR